MLVDYTQIKTSLRFTFPAAASEIVCGAGGLPALMVGMQIDQMLCQKSSVCLQFILTPWGCRGLWLFMMLTIRT